MATQTTSGYLMHGVSEEKSNRIMEILITSVKPMELLLGKILGLGALGLTQLLVWLVAGMVLLNVAESADVVRGVTLPPDLIVLALAYFLVGYFLFASVMAGMGAIAGSEQESRQYAGIFSLVTVIPFFFITQILFQADSPIALALTLIPFTAPLTVILRASLGGLPAWQLAASFAILLLTTLGMAWASARIFRWGLLMYGKRPTPRELWRVVRGANETRMGTSAAGGE